MFVVLNDIHSSSGKLKNVKQASMDLSKQLAAEGRSFPHLCFNISNNPKAFSFEGAQKMARI